MVFMLLLCTKGKTRPLIKSVDQKKERKTESFIMPLFLLFIYLKQKSLIPVTHLHWRVNNLLLIEAIFLLCPQPRLHRRVQHQLQRNVPEPVAVPHLRGGVAVSLLLFCLPVPDPGKSQN